MQRVIRVVDVPLAQLCLAECCTASGHRAGVTHIPGVDRNQTGLGRPGAVRRVLLADGTSALESIVENRPPEYFSYKVWPQNGARRRLLRYI